MCCSPWGRKESDTTERLNNRPPVRTRREEKTFKGRCHPEHWVTLRPVPRDEQGLASVVIRLSLWGGEKCAVWSLWSRKWDGKRTLRGAAVLGRSAGLGVSCRSFLSFQFPVLWLCF